MAVDGVPKQKAISNQSPSPSFLCLAGDHRVAKSINIIGALKMHDGVVNDEEV